MDLTYFDAKRELRKIYGFSLKAIKDDDKKYINFLILNLKQLKDCLETKFKIDAFGLYVLNKEIKQMLNFLDTKLKKK